jgi:hypothetical protein
LIALVYVARYNFKVLDCITGSITGRRYSEPSKNSGTAIAKII